MKQITIPVTCTIPARLPEYSEGMVSLLLVRSEVEGRGACLPFRQDVPLVRRDGKGQRGPQGVVKKSPCLHKHCRQLNAEGTIQMGLQNAGRILYVILLIAGLAGIQEKLSAQNLTNTGTLYVTSGTTLFMGSNFANNSGAITENNGIIHLDGDWTNDGTYIPDTGEVKLSGSNQLITGAVSTTFYDLTLQGTGIKTMMLDVTVTDTLRLNNLELATDSNTLFFTNTDTGAITRTTGFVSSLDTGSLSRNTDTTLTYLFPVGSSIGTLRYRPVEITPNAFSTHIFTVRMANVDATTEGFNRVLKDSTLSVINPDFYHHINRTSGTNPADITIYFDDSLDSTYQAMAHWQNLPQWENTGAVIVINNVSPVLSYITKTAWNDFSYTPFALSTEPLPVSLSSSDTIICEGDTITFTATDGFANYDFFVNGLAAQTGTDSIYITDTLNNGDTVMVVGTDSLGGKSLSDTIFIIVNPVYNTPVAASICSGDSLQLPLGSWVDSAGTYYDTLFAISGCDSVIATTVTVDSIQDATITTVLPVCANFTPYFLAAVDGGGTWSGLGILDVNTGLFDPSLAGVGSVEIIYTLGGGCPDADTVNLTVNDVPVLDLIGADETCEDADDGSVDLTVIGGTPAYGYSWDDLAGSSTEDVSGLAPGTYEVIVTDLNSCSDTGSVVIGESTILCYKPYVYVPNIFSPNGDGENDILFVQGKGISELIFVVYDRWGEKIFETTDNTLGWDGTYKGKNMNEQVFVYYIKAELVDGETVERKGSVALVK